MNRLTRVFAFAFICLIGASIAGEPAFAKPPWAGGGKGKKDAEQQVEPYTKGGKYDKDASGGTSSVGGLVLAGITAATAQSYAVEYNMTGAKPLPPGIQKKLARGKPLPPGIAKKMGASPMVGRLPVHPGYEWQVAGTDLLLVRAGTAIVADVLHGVFR